jgi:hypothetical protein
MRRLTLFISVALALLVFAIPATASAKRSHHKTRHSLRDRNHNGIPDRWEKKFHVHSASADPDRDGVTNLGEFNDGTNPRNPDTNGNGIEDGNDDANDDGVPDGQEQSGVIAGFDATTGKLTVTLVNGDTQTGTVNSDTEIECENTTAASTRDDGGDSQESGDDNSGTGSTNSGDDDQGDNNDQGDDNNDQAENEGNCGTDALQAGTIVKEAELRLTSGGAVFKDIELGGKAQA